MMAALQKSGSDSNYKHDLCKASEKLVKVHNEGAIRSYMDNLLQKNGADMYVFAASLSVWELIIYCINIFSELAVVGLIRKQNVKRKCLSKNWKEIREKLKRRRKDWNVNFKRKRGKL